MRVHSKKRAAIEREYKKIIRELEPYCFNCGTYNNLTPAHLVPRSRRRDLIAEKQNIVPLCLSCHKQLDQGDRKGLRRWQDILDRIKELDVEYYNLIR